MQKIFTLILDQNNQLQNIFIDADFTIEHQVTYVETQFINYIIQRQFEMGLNHFIDIPPAVLMDILGCKRVTVMNAFRKFRDVSVIYQLKCHGTEWKLNLEMCNIIKTDTNNSVA